MQTAIAILYDYSPVPGSPPGIGLANYLVERGFEDEQVATILYGRPRATRLFSAAEFMWMRALSESTFKGPQDAAKLERRLTDECNRIRDATTRKHFKIWLRDRFRYLFGETEKPTKTQPHLIVSRKIVPLNEYRKHRAKLLLETLEYTEFLRLHASPHPSPSPTPTLDGGK